MMNPFKVYPEPPTATLRRVCLGQAVVCLSALTSIAVLLSRVLPTILSGLN